MHFRLLIVVVLASSAASAGAKETDGIEFFEAKIRPVLVEQCYSCHSAKAKILRGNLLLDTREGLLKGGDSGPAVVVGKPDESVLIDALKYDGFEMPPSGRLSDAVVADFERWVKIGLPDPRVGTAVVAKQGMDIETGRKFWAFRPVETRDPPAVKNGPWCRDPIDRFILAALEEKKLQPSADADARTIIRRLSFDLIGLPPSAEEVEQFVDASSRDKEKAYAELVDRLLASPHFGERWGRHWLDVARFAESSGGGRSMVFKEAWRFRDYVIHSFNDDKPIDRFFVEQLAGDLLEHRNDAELEDHLVATAYLVLGANNYEEQDKKVLEMDVIDEQIEAFGRGMLGMTLGCARCHDHKFDPIPTADYYAMAGVLKSTHMMNHENVSQWTERKLPMSPEQQAAVSAHESAVADLKAKLEAAKAIIAKLQPEDALPKGPLAPEMLQGIVVDDDDARRIGDWTHSTSKKSYVGTGYLHDDNKGKGEKTLTFQPEFKKRGLYEVRLAYSEGGTRATKVPIEILSLDGEYSTKVDMKKTPPIDGRFVSLGKFNFDDTNQWFVMLSNSDTDGVVTADCVQFLPVNEDAKAKKKSAKPDASVADAEDVVESLEKEMKKLTSDAPPRPTAMAVEEAKEIVNCKLCVRGNAHNLGAEVPRGVLQVATVGEAPKMPKDHSGRLELAEWIADERNPLTARVYVNRIWQHLIGVGLVRTVDNFGTTGELPSHLELLDHLASRFTAANWSTKQLVRAIVMSSTYRQSSAANKKAAAVDPENRLLARMNRKRHDAESLRDAMLTVSGKLDPKVGGPNIGDPSVLKGSGTVTPTEYTYVFADKRRSVYTPAFRNKMLELFEAFDMADQNAVSGRRNSSTVAPQALYMLNAPFVQDQAHFAAERALADESLSDDPRIERAFQEALGRDPTDNERRIALTAVTVPTDAKDAAAERLAAWERLYQALFGCLDFRYVD